MFKIIRYISHNGIKNNIGIFSHKIEHNIINLKNRFATDKKNINKNKYYEQNTNSTKITRTTKSHDELRYQTNC